MADPADWKEIRARVTKDFYLLLALGLAILLILYLLNNQGSYAKEVNDKWEEWRVYNCRGIIGADDLNVINNSPINFSWGVTYEKND